MILAQLAEIERLDNEKEESKPDAPVLILVACDERSIGGPLGNGEASMAIHIL